MVRLMLTLSDDIYKILKKISERRGISVQELIRASIIPEWLEKGSYLEGEKR